MRTSLVVTFVYLTLGIYSQEYNKPQCQGNRRVIVHLFEWKWSDIANECEEYLGPKGFCAVQVSPPMEHLQGPEWWVRYQPVSYLLESRSGTRGEFVDMVQRCRAQGVNIYVDAVINHMTGQDRSGTGTAGSNFDGEAQNYPEFSKENFHQPPCPVNSYTDPFNVRNCYLVGLNDLDGSQSHVQDVQAAYLNDLIEIGVTGFRVDAAKHMWPADIEALQAKLKDVYSGGRPYFYMEVIDLSQSGEISVTEYYSLGQTTEFRYVIRVAEGVNNGFYGLQSYYDPGWGMSDYEHAFVFVDNHDNQRGHGGGGQVITHEQGVLYKYAQAFTLAHDYGTKRIMSSYYFDDSDQGPPDSSPGCGDQWVCEHRWKSIGQMVEFANSVYGEPVEFKVAEHSTLALSRGTKGFFAMGDLSQEFDTGLPDGSYCDIISECKQKVDVSGGRAYIEAYNSDDPVVAICQGCTGQNDITTTQSPSPTPGSSTITTGSTTTSSFMTTTTTPDFTTPKPASSTSPAPENCCEKIIFQSNGGVKDFYHEALGSYSLETINSNGYPLYKHQTQLVSFYLHYTVDTEFQWSGWQFTRDISDVFGFVSNEADDLCPNGDKNTPWRYQLDGTWYEDDTVTLTCEDDGPTTTTTSPGSSTTTSDGTSTTTSDKTSEGTTTKPPPNPGAQERTIIFIEKETYPCQDIFIIGGQSDGKSPIDITINSMPEQWNSYNSWMIGDNYLDWDGTEADQGTFNGYEALGTAAALTSNDPSDKFYFELNDFGSNYWVVDMDLDCDQTQEKWVEFKTILRHCVGGEDIEPSIDQDDCTGQFPGKSPIAGSSSHMALCGYMNIFSYGANSCQINSISSQKNDDISN